MPTSPADLNRTATQLQATARLAEGLTITAAQNAAADAAKTQRTVASQPGAGKEAIPSARAVMLGKHRTCIDCRHPV